MKSRTYQIKEVAEIANVTSRTLRHYDEIGLLVPSMRSAAGYRLYTDADLLRLQQILIGRSLGLALEDIRSTIDKQGQSRKPILLKQREALLARAEATAKMIRSIDAAIALIEKESNPEDSIVDMKQIFDGFDPAEYEEEVKQRWGATDAYQESSRRTRKYTADDWRRIKDDSNEILSDAIALLRDKTDPQDAKAMDVAERYRLWVDRWFYACKRGMHANLAEVYEGDARFAKYFDDRAIGLAAFMSGAIRANALR